MEEKFMRDKYGNNRCYIYIKCDCCYNFFWKLKWRLRTKNYCTLNCYQKSRKKIFKTKKDVNGLCEYGCGQEAKYQFKNGKWCCSNNISKCSKTKEKKGIIIKIKHCVICGIEHKKRGTTCGKKECIQQAMKWTPQQKANQSIKQSNYLRNNQDKIKWGKGIESDPEKRFKVIINKINMPYKIYQYYRPPENKRFFELDFAIPELKIDFEINGNMHYDRQGNLKEYYQKRHDYLKEKGWDIIEIHYLVCYHEDKIIKIIQDALDNKFEYCKNITKEIFNYKQVKIKKENNKIKSKRTIKEYTANQINEWAEKHKIEMVKNSNIDFTKFGWVQKVADLINIKRQHVNKFVCKYLPKIMVFKKGQNKIKRITFVERKEKWNKIWIERANIVKNSNIDFNKLGWVKLVETLTKIPHSRVGKFMQKYLPVIYKNSYIKGKSKKYTISSKKYKLDSTKYIQEKIF